MQTIAFGLIDSVESRAADLQASAQSLSGTLDTTIQMYQGLDLNKKTRSLKFARRAVAVAA